MQQRRLIEKTAGSCSLQSETIEVGRAEVAFHLLELRGIVLDVVGSSSDVADIIVHAIARMPTNLRCHIQRINLFIAKKDEESLYGSLLDLFIILGDQGYLLRDRMLKNACPVMRKECYELLKQHLKSGLSSKNGVIFSPASILSGDLAASHSLIKRISSDITTAQDPIEAACDHLEYGQVDAARQVLESAIENAPSRIELYQELLEIYKCTRDQVRYQEIHKRLSADNHPFLQRWMDVADLFGGEG